MPCENSARKRSKTMAFRCTPEARKLICEMAAWRMTYSFFRTFENRIAA